MVEITVPLNTNLTAGAVIRCVFPRIDREERKDEDKNTSGLYMIKNSLITLIHKVLIQN